MGKRTHAQAVEGQADNADMEQDKSVDKGTEDTGQNDQSKEPDNAGSEINAQGQRIAQKTLRTFVSTKNGQPYLITKNGKHPDSLWRDE